METVYEKGDRFVMRTGTLRREFEIVQVVIIPAIRGKKARKAKREYHVKNNSLEEHPAMNAETKERLRYFKIKDEVLDGYIKQGKWNKL
jgi:hypothetical protein